MHWQVMFFMRNFESYSFFFPFSKLSDRHLYLKTLFAEANAISNQKKIDDRSE